MMSQYRVYTVETGRACSRRVNRRPARALALAAWLCVAGGCSDNDRPDPKEKAVTYTGVWVCQDRNERYHVAEISFEANEFPCAGAVSTRRGHGQTIGVGVTWEKKGDELVGSADWETKKYVATVSLSDKTLSGKVTFPITIDGVTDLTFSGFVKDPNRKHVTSPSPDRPGSSGKPAPVAGTESQPTAPAPRQ